MSIDERQSPNDILGGGASPSTWATVHALGDVDASSARALVDRVQQAARDADVGVVVDFARAEFVGSAAVSALVEAQASLASTGRELMVRYPPRLLRWMLGIFGLDGIVEPTAGEQAGSGGELPPLSMPNWPIELTNRPLPR